MRLALLAVFLLSACEWVANSEDYVREAAPIFKSKTDDPEPAKNPTKLKVMAWNVKYGACRIDFWFDFWGDRVQMTTEEVDGCLTRIESLIKEYDPDVVINEEIEVNSRRSAYTDMVQRFLDHTNLRFAAYFQVWDSRYVPSEGLGRVDMGNAVFSKYPIVKAERIRQADRTDQDALTATFYLHRAFGRAELDLGDRNVAIYALHTEAYDQDGTKQKHIKQIYDEVKGETLQFMVGGDFNELPPLCDEKAADGAADSCKGVLRLTGFLDERASAAGTDYEQPPYTPSVMKPFFDDFTPFIPLSKYGTTEAEQRRYFTHSVLGPELKNDSGVPGFWNRTLDYMFVKKTDSWEGGKSDVLQQQGDSGIRENPIELSDHAPIVGTWDLGGAP